MSNAGVEKVAYSAEKTPPKSQPVQRHKLSDVIAENGNRDRIHPKELKNRTVCVVGLSRVIHLLLAGLFFGLAVLGAVLPVLPTTPFLLLTSYFLARSSPRWNRVLLNSRFFGPILRDWQQHRGVRRSVKVRAVALVVLFVGVSCWATNPSLPVFGMIAAAAGVGIAVVIFLPEVK